MRFDSHGIDESLEGILRRVGIHPGLEGLRPVGIHEGFCRWELEDETIVINRMK
jgi:hypothetical protein